MSQIVYELDQIVDRILLIAPTQARLYKRFASLAEELTLNVGAQQNLNLVSTRLNSGPLKCWMAFDLGKRAQLSARIQILGISLDDERMPSPEILQANEALLLDWEPGNPADDAFLRLQLTQHNKEHPCLALIANTDFSSLRESGLTRIRAKAQKKGLEESFDKFMLGTRPEDFFKQGLEWILSF